MKSLKFRVFCLLFCLIAAPRLSQADLLVSDNFGNQILRYNETTGAFLGVLIANPDGVNGSRLSAPTGMQVGPDGLLWVANGEPRFANANGVQNSIQRYTLGGQYVDTFAAGGNLNAPSSIQFGPDGQLYVANLGGESTGFQGDSVLRFNPTNGSTSTKIGVGTISGASYLRFDGSTMYVSNYGFNPLNQTANGSVQRYNSTTGALIDTFVTGSGLQTPTGLAVSGGNLYVADTFAGKIKRYNSITGAFVDDFITIPVFPTTNGAFPSDIMFQGSNLLVNELGYGTIARFDSTGADLAPFAFGGSLITPGFFLSNVAAIPEPSTWVSLGMLGIFSGWYLKRRKRSAE